MPKDNESTSEADSKIASVSEPVAEMQLAELRELTRSLMSAVQTMQTQSARGFELREAIGDVKAATRSMLAAPIGLPYPSPTDGRKQDCNCGEGTNCGCGPCECVASSCCTFKIEMSELRITQMQTPLEFVDAAANPFAEMEMRLFPSINGIGPVIPNMYSTLPFRKPLLKPGHWYPINRYVGTVTVCKGTPKKVDLNLAAVEVDDGGVEATAARDEYGTANFSMVLDCCSSQPTTATVEVHLDYGGLGGGTFEARFVATRECC